jgi:uncharacterized protein YbjT (DUF2867 family)
VATARTVLVIGGTRGTGLIIARLLRERQFPVRVLARDPVRARTLFDTSTEVVHGDVTRPQTLVAAVKDAAHVVFTAGCRSGYPVLEGTVKAVEHDGVVNTLRVARDLGFTGRFLYMTSSGVTRPSASTFALNVWKGNTLVWRRRVEVEIRRSGVDYTVIRTGILLNRKAGTHRILITQAALPLSIRYRIARADVAQVFVAALEHPRASRATLETMWGSRGSPGDVSLLLGSLAADDTVSNSQ